MVLQRGLEPRRSLSLRDRLRRSFRFAQKTLRVLVSVASSPTKRERRTDRPLACLSFFGAPAGTRTPDTLLKRQVLYLLSYWGASSSRWGGAFFFIRSHAAAWLRMAGMAGLEPTISESKSGVLPLHYIPGSSLQKGRRSRPFCSVGWDMGLEPTTPGTTIRCSAN